MVYSRRRDLVPALNQLELWVMGTAVSSATIGTAYLRGEPVRGVDRAYAISQLAGAIMAEVADWTEAQILVECRRLNRLRCQPHLADEEVRNGVRRTIASLRRQTWREIELRSWLDYSHPTLHTFPHTVESERQVLLIGQTIDEMREEGYSDAVILRECQVLNARYFAPPLDPAPLRGFIDYVLSRGRLYDAVAAESALARASETCSDV